MEICYNGQTKGAVTTAGEGEVTMEQQTNHTLVHRAKNGDADAFAALYEGVYKDLYRFALYMMGNQAEAEDAVSEAVVSAYESIQKLRSEAAFRGWMFQILVNKCKRLLKSRSKAHAPIDDNFPSEQTDLDDAILVRKAFAALQEKERHILALTIFAGYNSKEVAKIMKSNANTIRSIKNRSLDKMKEFMSPS